MARFVAVAGLALALSPARVEAEPTFEFASLQRTRLQKVVVRSPPHTNGEVLLLLHGNHGKVTDPTWLVGLAADPRFERSTLIVPALYADDYDWERPSTLTEIVALVEKVLAGAGVDKARVHVVGYSAGAARVLSVVHALLKRQIAIATVTAVAGDARHGLSGRTHAEIKALLGRPILLVCMQEDDSHGSCVDTRRALTALRDRGGDRVDLTELPGPHALDLRRFAPVLGAWLDRVAPAPVSGGR